MSEVNNLTPYTIKSTGVSVFIRPIPPMLLRAVDKAAPQPEAPLETIEGPDGATYQERNRSHPDYLQALAERRSAVSEAVTELCFLRGVVINLTDDQRAEAESVRAFMRDQMGVELHDSAEVVYLKHIAVATPDDLRDLVGAVSGRSVPTDPKSPSG